MVARAGATLFFTDDGRDRRRVAPRFRDEPQAASQFVRGFQHALLSAAGITFAAAVIAVTTVRKNHPTDEAKALDAADR